MKTIRTKILVVSILFSAAVPRVLFSAEKCSSLVFAADMGELKTIESLLEFNVDVDVEEDGETALMAASFRGHCSIIKLLLKHNADVCKKSFFKTVLECAMDDVPDLTVVKVLLDAKADPNDEGLNGSPLKICKERIAGYCGKEQFSDRLSKFTEVLKLFHESEAVTE